MPVFQLVLLDCSLLSALKIVYSLLHTLQGSKECNFDNPWSVNEMTWSLII